MKNHDTLIRVPLSQGNFSTISSKILLNANLTSDAKLLLQLLLNNDSTEWKISLSYYSKKLGWTKNKQANAVANLTKNGFLKAEKYVSPSTKQFQYRYVVSEYGDLVGNGRIEQPVEQKSEVSKSKAKNKASNGPIPVEHDAPKPVDVALINSIIEILMEVVQEYQFTDESFVMKIITNYEGYISDGVLDNKTFNPKTTKSTIQNQIMKEINKQKVAFMN